MIVRILTRHEWSLAEKAGSGNRLLVPEMTKHSVFEGFSEVRRQTSVEWRHQGSLGFESRDNGAGSSRRIIARSRKPRQRIPCGLHLSDLGIQRGDALPRKFAGAGAVVGRIQGDQLGDLLQREPGCLRGTDEPSLRTSCSP
jgi:hypothetical protein